MYYVHKSQPGPNWLRPLRHRVEAAHSGDTSEKLEQRFRETYQNEISGVQRDELRRRLFSDQKGLCGFCAGRISSQEFPHTESTKKGIKIAHLVPQSVDGTQALSWTNMLGACHGGESFWDGRDRREIPSKDQHCDTMQADRRLHPLLNPLSRNIEQSVRCLNNGVIEALHEEEEERERLQACIGHEHRPETAQPEGDLNLNHPTLIQNRRAAIDKVQNSLQRKAEDRRVTAHLLESELQKWQSPNGAGCLREYAPYAIAYLQKKLRAINR